VEGPHVVSLRYRLQAADTVAFQNPPRIERETDAFQIRLEDGVATAWLKEHHSSPDNARRVVEKYLRLWELHAALQYGGSPDVSFQYESAQVRQPPQPPAGAPQVIRLSAASASVSAVSATVHTTKSSYPYPPDDFALSDDVEVLWALYDGYRQGRDRLLPMAFTCLSRLQYSAGNRARAAKRYRIDSKVLATLANLTTNLGVGAEARKWDRNTSKLREPTMEEKRWIEAAVLALIRRAGQIAFKPDAECPKIKMSDLPKL
jgi:hypothetical protein